MILINKYPKRPLNSILRLMMMFKLITLIFFYFLIYEYEYKNKEQIPNCIDVGAIIISIEQIFYPILIRYLSHFNPNRQQYYGKYVDKHK